MKILLILLITFSFSSFSKDEKAAREVFQKYLTSIEKKDLQLLLSISDENFLKETGGKDHWKEVMEAFNKDYSNVEVLKVELRTDKGRYYGRFSFKSKKIKEKPLSDKWFLLQLDGEKFVIHDFLDHFVPGEKVE